MEFNHRQTVKIIALILLLAALLQPVYTLLYYTAPDVNRKFIWGIEAFLFLLLSVFAGSALTRAKNYALGFSAIAFSAIVNVVQVGVGLTQFGPVRAAAQANAELSGIASSVVSYSFFGYNAAKTLLAMAAVIFGMAVLKTDHKVLSKSIGGTAIIIGAAAFITNALVMMFGIQGFVPRPLAGGTGVAATFFLALNLLSLKFENEIEL